MKVNQIVVTAGRTFNHPYESYSNLRPEVRITATVAEGEDVIKATRDLQRQAETLVEDHKSAMLSSIHELQNLTEKKARVQQLGECVQRAQSELDELRKQHPELRLPA